MLVYLDPNPRPKPGRYPASEDYQIYVEGLAKGKQDSAVITIAELLAAWRLCLELQQRLEMLEAVCEHMQSMLLSATLRMMDGNGPKDGRA